MRLLLSLSCCFIFFSGSLAFGQKIVVINEVMYKPAGGKVDNEFVELYNPQNKEIDLSGWTLSPLIEYEFPNNTILGSEGYLVVSRNKDFLAGKYTGISVSGNYRGSLAGGPKNFSGGLVVLKNPKGVIVDHVSWSFRNFGQFGPDWSRLKSNSLGASLELVNPAADPVVFSNWDASSTTDGTPGKRNSQFKNIFEEKIAGTPWLTPGDDPAKTITLNWRTAMPFICRIEYRKNSDSSSVSVVEDRALTMHHLTLRNLEPETEYEYRIFCNERFSFSSKFKTSSNSEKSFNFSVFGNSRNFPERFGKVIKGISARQNDFVVSLGDTVDSGGVLVEYAPWFFNVGAKLFSRIPIVPVIGHHENFICRLGPGMDQQLGHHVWNSFFRLPLDRKDEAYYSFDYGDAHFVILDWYLMDKPQSSQTLWLEQDLAATSKKWKFVFFHSPMYSPRIPYYDYQVGYRLTSEPIFIKYGVDLVFCAHMHYYERLFVNGIYHIITGGAGSPPTPKPEGPRPPYSQLLSGWEGHKDETHYVSVNVTKQSVEIKAVNDQNETFDEIIIRKKQK